MSGAVAITAVHCLEPGTDWSASATDLLVAAAEPILPPRVDALFCAAGSFPLFQRQANAAAIACDRLSLRCPAFTLDAGDLSVAIALCAAWQFVTAHPRSIALVLGAAKLSDFGENERISILDTLLDGEGYAGAGRPSFAAQAGLLAAALVRQDDLPPDTFATISAANYARWASGRGARSPTAAALAQDLVVAPPLVRSDFAALHDGAGALVLSSDPDALPLAMLAGTSAASDVVDVWDRPDPFNFSCVREAARLQCPDYRPEWIEIDTFGSLAEHLTMRALDGLWPAVHGQEPMRRNTRGASQGRGRPFGVSTIYIVDDFCRAANAGESALLLAISGLGAAAVAARLVKDVAT